jgi:hypothetical protein
LLLDTFYLLGVMVRHMVFNATFNNISIYDIYIYIYIYLKTTLLTTEYYYYLQICICIIRKKHVCHGCHIFPILFGLLVKFRIASVNGTNNSFDQRNIVYAVRYEFLKNKKKIKRGIYLQQFNKNEKPFIFLTKL